MLLLAFDTATPAVTVALRGDEGVLAEHTEIDARRHGELLAPGIEKVLAAAGCSRTDLTGVAVGVGPGPFTGLRVGLMTARALGDALDIPVHGVCTLDILAAAVAPGTPFAVATDARRREVYWATYDMTGRRETDPEVDRPAEIAELLTGRPVAGQGSRLYPEQFPAALDPELPSAAVLADLTARLLRDAPETLLPPHPLYLRRPDAVEPGARKPVGTQFTAPRSEGPGSGPASTSASTSTSTSTSASTSSSTFSSGSGSGSGAAPGSASSSGSGSGSGRAVTSA